LMTKRDFEKIGERGTHELTFTIYSIILNKLSTKSNITHATHSLIKI
jgi:hypothetical protein